MTEAKKYASKRVSSTNYPVYNDEYELELAFEEGAKWQRNGVWHTANEQPDPNRLLCVCCADFRDKIIVIDEYKPKEQRFYYEDGENYDYISLEHEGLRWAYIEDLLPEQIIKQK